MNWNDLIQANRKYIDAIIENGSDRFKDPTTTQSWLDLVEALKSSLEGSVPPESLFDACVIAAKELVSRAMYPEGSGAAALGMFPESEAFDPDVEAQAEMPIPPPVVTRVIKA
jgi:hypothetical protein